MTESVYDVHKPGADEDMVRLHIVCSSDDCLHVMTRVAATLRHSHSLVRTNNPALVLGFAGWDAFARAKAANRYRVPYSVPAAGEKVIYGLLKTAHMPSEQDMVNDRRTVMVDVYEIMKDSEHRSGIFDGIACSDIPLFAEVANLYL